MEKHTRSAWWISLPTYAKPSEPQEPSSWAELLQQNLLRSACQEVLGQLPKEMFSLLVETKIWSIDEAFSVSLLLDEQYQHQTWELLCEALSSAQLLHTLRASLPRHGASSLVFSRVKTLRTLAARGHLREALDFIRETKEDDKELYLYGLYSWLSIEEKNEIVASLISTQCFADDPFGLDLLLVGCSSEERRQLICSAVRSLQTPSPEIFVYLCQAAKHHQQLCSHQICPFESKTGWAPVLFGDDLAELQSEINALLAQTPQEDEALFLWLASLAEPLLWKLMQRALQREKFQRWHALATLLPLLSEERQRELFARLLDDAKRFDTEEPIKYWSATESVLSSVSTNATPALSSMLVKARAPIVSEDPRQAIESFREALATAYSMWGIGFFAGDGPSLAHTASFVTSFPRESWREVLLSLLPDSFYSNQRPAIALSLARLSTYTSGEEKTTIIAAALHAARSARPKQQAEAMLSLMPFLPSERHHELCDEIFARSENTFGADRPELLRGLLQFASKEQQAPIWREALAAANRKYKRQHNWDHFQWFEQVKVLKAAPIECLAAVIEALRAFSPLVSILAYSAMYRRAEGEAKAQLASLFFIGLDAAIKDEIDTLLHEPSSWLAELDNDLLTRERLLSLASIAIPQEKHLPDVWYKLLAEKGETSLALQYAREEKNPKRRAKALFLLLPFVEKSLRDAQRGEIDAAIEEINPNRRELFRERLFRKDVQTSQAAEQFVARYKESPETLEQILDESFLQDNPFAWCRDNIELLSLLTPLVSPAQQEQLARHLWKILSIRDGVDAASAVGRLSALLYSVGREALVLDAASALCLHLEQLRGSDKT